MFLGAALYVAAVSKTVAVPSTVAYSGRGFDKKTLSPIRGAQVTLDILGSPPALAIQMANM